MRRTYAFVIGIALLIALPGLASADTRKEPVDSRRLVGTAIARGLSQRGVPYVYGGGDADGPTGRVDPAPDFAGFAPAPSAPGFDASGLMVYSFAGAGIKLPRTSGDQYKFGRRVLPAQALPGDLIFYGPEGTRSVAMFVGNGQMLEASEPVVAVSPVRFSDMAPYLVRVIE